MKVLGKLVFLDFPESVLADCIKALAQVYKGHLEVTMLFHALFLELTQMGGKYHVRCSFTHSQTCAEAALTLGEESLLKVFQQVVEEDVGNAINRRDHRTDDSLYVSRSMWTIVVSLNSWG